jgi:hypothetical protein
MSIRIMATRFFLMMFCVAGLAACAVTESSLEDVGTQFEQGIQGRGQIVPNDPTSDGFGPIYQ